jgi:hypothetical protein
MNKNQTETIKQIIKEFKEYDYSLVDKRFKFFFDNDYVDIFYEINEENENNKELNELLEIFDYIEEKNDKLLIKLNNLLDEKDKDNDINKLEEEIKLIQNKKYITVNEFEKMFNVSKSSQRDLRSRLRNPLPYHQKIEGGKIVYVVSEVEKWFSNQYK